MSLHFRHQCIRYCDSAVIGRLTLTYHADVVALIFGTFERNSVKAQNTIYIFYQQTITRKNSCERNDVAVITILL